MFNSRNQSIFANQSKTEKNNTGQAIGIVYDVILDVLHPILDERGIADDNKPQYIGSVTYRLFNAGQKSDSDLGIALPYDVLITALPTKNEVITLISLPNGSVRYLRTNIADSPNLSAVENAISSTFKKSKGAGANSKDYKDTSDTGISKSNADDGNKYDGFGKYFTANTSTHRLKLYEGDTILESRFGQSVRFSGYNNPENEYNPTITIRNGENGESLANSLGTDTEEDINKDGNIIFLGSGDHLLKYTLPTENTYASFFNYPSELKGNQIVLNSDRIILSAKAAEMIFVSKKDTGFITDGQFSIDATDGINITTTDTIEIDTTDNDIKFDIGEATMFLGTDGELEKAVKGDTLQALLEKLIELISQQVFLTPSGPSATGPVNIAEFSSLKSKIKTMLSDNIQLK